jgi:hypothetical protein
MVRERLAIATPGRKLNVQKRSLHSSQLDLIRFLSSLVEVLSTGGQSKWPTAIARRINRVIESDIPIGIDYNVPRDFFSNTVHEVGGTVESYLEKIGMAVHHWVVSRFE